MRLQILSDLHLETQPDWTAAPAPDADLLVLAGDIGSYQRGSRLQGDDFGLGRFAPRPGWSRVLFVPGNHEYDGLDHDATGPRLQALCARLGIEWLDRRIRVIDGVRFIGTTLWSDFAALGHLDKALRAADWYLSRNTTLREGRLVMAAELREMALDCQRWLRAALCEPHDGPTVVVSHFAPTLDSADPRYGMVPGTAGFCNTLDELLPLADLWIHGHLHCPVDVTRAGCRIVCNALGYVHKGEQDGHRPGWCVEVPRPSAEALTARRRAAASLRASGVRVPADAGGG
ncbi:MAG: metallophosphoesterase [Sphaerotilus sulfidivorans]|jgi:predicted phosphodiesterase|uniref:metallophosphoesterase n=1 Tax=Sphaerotilus sulfidivorans TaxID=639200 RepID=UPI0032282024